MTSLKRRRVMGKQRTLVESAVGLAAHLNKKFKDAAVKITHPHKDDSPTKVKRWIPTGCKALDISISNLADVGGYPSGRLTVLYGPEQSGKSLAAMHALAETQKMGGHAIYIDTEQALHEGFAKAIGIDTEADTFIHIPIRDLSVIFQVALESIQVIRAVEPDAPVTIVVDSIAAATTAKDEAATDVDFNVKGYNTEKAKMLSDGLSRLITVIAEMDVCLIVTNQVRMNMNAQPFSDPYRMPHGQSLPHYASVIVKMVKGKKITMEMVKGWKRPVGRETIATIKKNRLGPPEAVVNFDIYYDRGIDDYGSWKVYAELFKLTKKSGAWVMYEYVDPATGEVIEYRAHGWTNFCKEVLETNPDVAHTLWEAIATNYIMHYAKKSSDVDNLVRDGDDSNDD